MVFYLGNPYIYSTRPDSTNQFKIIQLVVMTKENPTENKQIDWYPKPEGTEGLTPFVPKHQGRKLQIWYFWFLSPLVLLLDLLNVLGGNRKPYSGSLEDWSHLPPVSPYGSNQGQKCVWLLTSLLLLLELLE